MKNQKNFKKGFTLVEMMIVVAIIAILAGIAVPEYTKYVMKSKASEASRFMKQIADAEVTYYATHNRRYITSLGPLGVDIPADTMFDYNITKAEATCFQIRATGTKDDIKDRELYLVYPDRNSSDVTAECLTDTNDDDYWDGNIYFGKFYQDPTTTD